MDTISNGTKAPGAKSPDIATIEKWVAKDVSMCISFLTAIHQDVDLRRQVAVWMKGRMDNEIHRPNVGPINSED